HSNSPGGILDAGSALLDVGGTVAEILASHRAEHMVATHPISIEQFATTSRDGLWELIDGEPVAVTPSSDRSGWIAGEVFGHLRDHVRTHNLGRVFPPETGFVLFADRSTVRSPDAAFVRGDRLPGFTERLVTLATDL